MVFLLALMAIVAPVLALSLLVISFQKINSPIAFAVVIGLAMAGISFGLHNTSIYSDLTTYMGQAMLTQGLSIDESLNLFSRGHMSDTPIAIFWFWLVGQTGNAQWYPASIAFVEYAIIGFIFTDYAKDAQYTRRQYGIIILLLIITLPLYNSVSSVRSTPALAIGILGFYLDFCKHIRNPFVYLLYAIAILIHSIGFILLPLRLICQLGIRCPRLAVVLTIVLLPSVYFFASVLDPIFSQFGFSVIDKVQSYVAGSDSEYALHVADSNFLQVKKWVSIILAAVSIVLQLRALTEKNDKSDLLHKRLCLIGCALAAVIVSFGIIISMPSYARFLYTAVPVSALVITRGRLDDKLGKQTQSADSLHAAFYVLFLLLVAAEFALVLYELPRRIAVGDLAWYVAFGFFGSFVS